MAVWQWSETANANAGADPFVNWAEGMSPSSVNDSARAMMAKIAEWRDDMAGSLTTAGTSAAYTVSTNALAGGNGIAATPNDGQAIAVNPHATNGLTPTFAADGGTAFPIQTSPGNAVPSATLVAGTPYVLVFKASASAWLLRSYFANPFNIPLGGMMPYLGTTAPNTNFALPFGQAISRTTYAALFNLPGVGTRYGVGDGTTTFNLPDLRGRTIFGQDNMGGTPANRITVAGGNFDGTTLGAVGGSQNRPLTVANIPQLTGAFTTGVESATHTHSSPMFGGGAGGPFGPANTNNAAAGGTTMTTSTESAAHTHTTTVTLGTGSPTAVPAIPPSMILPIILRIF